MNQNDRLNKKPKYWAISAAVIMVAAFVLVQPTMQASAVEAEGHDYDLCTNPATVAEDPITMNTIRNGQVAKTVFAEKEEYNCKLVQGAFSQNVTVVVTIFAEIFENMTEQTIIKKTAEVITCVKTPFQAFFLGCFSYNPTTDTIFTGTACTEYASGITHPQEMNTVNKGRIVKTIEAEKEIFDCPVSTDFKKVDLITFTEIWEDLGELPGDTILKKTVEELRCVTLVTDGEVAGTPNPRQDAFVESCIFRDLPVTQLL